MLILAMLLLLLSTTIELEPRLDRVFQGTSIPMPPELTESEIRAIDAGKNPKAHVDAALKVSDSRLLIAQQLSQQNQHQDAAHHLRISTSLIVYADSYTRQILATRKKDFESSLKKIEQAIFKQTPRLEAISRDLPYDLHEASLKQIAEIKRIRVRAIDDLLGGGKTIR